MTRTHGSQIRWGRVVAAAVLSEVLVMAAVTATMLTYRFLIAPGRTAAEYDAFTNSANSLVAPLAAGVAAFAAAVWACRKLTSAFVANGILVGAAAVILTGGLFFVARPEDRILYGVSYFLRIIGGWIGGAVAQRTSSTRPVHVPASGPALP
jgi:hypothetical protein